jgi:hypothetical protein
MSKRESSVFVQHTAVPDAVSDGFTMRLVWGAKYDGGADASGVYPII